MCHILCCYIYYLIPFLTLYIKYYYHIHFTNKKTEVTEKLRNLPNLKLVSECGIWESIPDSVTLEHTQAKGTILGSQRASWLLQRNCMSLGEALLL